MSHTKHYAYKALKSHTNKLNQEAAQLLQDLKDEYQYYRHTFPPEYNSYIRSSLWYDLRRKLIEERKTCKVCGSMTNLCVHHRHYMTLGHENPPDIILLCSKCHALVHHRNARLLADALNAPMRRIHLTEHFLRTWLPKLSENELKVYLCLKSYADKTGYAYPTQETIADFVGICKKTVKKAVRRLETNALLTLEYRKAQDYNGKKFGRKRYFYSIQ